jgi:hypothetical protein
VPFIGIEIIDVIVNALGLANAPGWEPFASASLMVWRKPRFLPA